MKNEKGDIDFKASTTRHTHTHTPIQISCKYNESGSPTSTKKKITQVDDELSEPSSTLIPGPVPGDEFESPAPLIACISSGSSQLSSTVALTLLTYSFIFSR